MNDVAQGQALRLVLYVLCSECSGIIGSPGAIEGSEMSKGRMLCGTLRRNTLDWLEVLGISES
jgi:hypothetical protein